MEKIAMGSKEALLLLKDYFIKIFKKSKPVRVEEYGWGRSQGKEIC